MKDIVERLEEIAKRNPDFEADPTISNACRDAIAEITGPGLNELE